MAPEVLQTTCCVVGGGPAGVMLGYLLARSGVRVTVLEKHKDFFRDFRGDTVHPSTLEVLKELDLLEEFLKLPHQQVNKLGILVGGSYFDVADFRHVPTSCKFIALMPQWDFLNFLSSHAKRFRSFELLMEHEATGLIKDGDRTVGVRARNGERELLIRADLVVGCDGRHAVTRDQPGMKLIEHGVPMDVLWFRISRTKGDPEQVLGNVNYGKALILIDRADYFQAGLIIAKGSFDEIKARGLGSFHADLREIAPYLGDRVKEVVSWDQVKILTVQINRLRQWHQPGLLCIGDAAHAMSPAGGVGINLAVQDAVATANLLTSYLLERRVPESALMAVQRRREFPTRVTQFVQTLAHKQLARVFENPGPIKAPWQLKVVTEIPGVHRALGYAVGVGARPEHVRQNPAEMPRCPRKTIAIFAGIGFAASAIAAAFFVVWKASSVD